MRQDPTQAPEADASLDPTASLDSTAGLDPADWPAFRALAHRIVDGGLDHIQHRRDQPVWRQMPPDQRARWDAPLSEGPAPLDQIWADLSANLLPYGMGNTHPRFFGWYMGGSTPSGALADFLAAIEASNMGGGDTAAAGMDQQVCRWVTAAMGFPASASATLTSGGSMANLIGLQVARNAMAGVDVRAEGITNLPQPLVFYASDEVHSATQKALEALGLGARALHVIPTNADFRMDLTALAAAVALDRAAGKKPACVIGTAGTTSTGSIDDLAALAAFCAEQGLWFHVDGAIGAILRLSETHRSLVAGLEHADSLALDLHKWFQAPFECGCAVMRDSQRHFDTFNMHPPYLQAAERGVAAGPFLGDYGLELSRSLKALKVWMALREHGSAAFGRLFDQQIALAQRLTRALQASADFEITAPTVINIVNFRHRGHPGMTEDQIKTFNIELMLRLQESGIASPSDTTIQGRHSLRAAIVNHRCQPQDIDLFVAALHQTGAELLAEPPAGPGAA